NAATPVTANATIASQKTARNTTMKCQLQRSAQIAILLLFVIVFGVGPSIAQTTLATTSGTLSFQKTWGGTGFDRADGVPGARDGTIYVVGSTQSFSVDGHFDVLLLRYAADGTLLFQKTYGPSGDEFGTGIAVAAEGSVYVAGSSADSK